MPNDMINALLGQQTEVPRQPSPFGAEPPRPEDAISNLYRSNAPKSSWLGGAAKGGELEGNEGGNKFLNALDTLSKFTPGPSDRGKPPPPGEGFWEGFQKQGILPAALMGARASGVRLTPSTHPGRDPTLQLRGRYTRLQDHGAYMNHPAIGKWPFIASSQLASNLYGRDEVPEDGAPAIEHPQQNNAPATTSNPVAERWGEMAPPRQEMPPPESLALQSGRFMPQPGGFPAAPASVPMPRPNPLPPKDFINPILMTKPYPKKREADASKDQPQHDWRRSGMMHMEQGGYNPGQPMVVGENGPEVVVPGGPSSVIPNSLAVQSGMLQAPTGSFPETGRERRSRKSGEFDASAKDFLSNPANVLSLGGPALIPAAMAMESSPNEGPLKKQESLPVGGTKAKTGQTVAGFPEPRPTLSREDQAKLNVMNTEIEKHNATIARHAALKEDKPALYASRTAGALAALQRLTKEASDIEGPHRKNTEAWQERANNYMVEQNKALLQQQQKEAAANERFQTRNPGWGDAAPKYGAGLAGTMGGLMGLTGKGKILKPMAQGFGLGSLEGFGAASFPNLADAGALPFGSQNQQDAAWQMLDPAFLGTKVLPEMGLHGIAGALGASGAASIPHLINSGASSIKAIAKWLKNPTGAKAPSVPRAKAAPPPPPPMATQPPPILPEAVVPTPVKRPRKKKTAE